MCGGNFSEQRVAKAISIFILLTVLSCQGTSEEEGRADEIIPEVNAESEIETTPIEAIDSVFEEIDTLANSLTQLIAEYSEFNGFVIDTYSETYQIEGDFYGDGTEDMAILVKDSTITKIGIIDYGNETVVRFVSLKGNFSDEADYSWVGVFKTVEKGDTLWSNYVDDWRGIEDVPADELVVLDYDAIYAHYPESCGGGFIFWKDEQWNWLQQE